MKYVKTYESFLQEKKKKGLWANIEAKRKRGEKPAKPGDEDYPDEEAWKAAQEAITTDGTVKCDKCTWEWDIATGGNDPYICHKCGHDNKPK